MADKLLKVKTGSKGRLIPQPDSRIWGCSLNAFAVASGTPLSILEEWIGHDGGGICTDEYGDPYHAEDDPDRFVGFTDYEIILALYWHNVRVITLAVDELTDVEKANLQDRLWGERAVIYYNLPDGTLHAVAWCEDQIVDIRRRVHRLADIPLDAIVVFYVVM